MLEREDGPTKHYRYLCDGKGCKAKTKRGIEQPPDLDDPDLAGWTEVEESETVRDTQHFCPKCSGNAGPPKVTEIIKKDGTGVQLSDHCDASVFLKREGDSRLSIAIGNGVVIVVTADTPVKVEKTLVAEKGGV